MGLSKNDRRMKVSAGVMVATFIATAVLTAGVAGSATRQDVVDAAGRPLSKVAEQQEFGHGSVLGVIKRPPVPVGSIDRTVAAVSVGSDYNGHYIQFSPADQRSFLSGWSTFMLGSLGLILGPLGAVILGSFGSAIGPQMEQNTCAAHNKSIRYTYTLDGNLTNVRCV